MRSKNGKVIRGVGRDEDKWPENWPVIYVYVYEDANGALCISLDQPTKGLKAKQVQVPAPYEAPTLTTLYNRVSGALKERTGENGPISALRILKQIASDERERKAAESRARADSRWSKERSQELPPIEETGQSVRTVSGGLPGLGKRR